MTFGFNTEAYEKRLAALTQQLLDGADQGWRGTLELRYAQHLLQQAAAFLTRASVDLPKAYSGHEREKGAAAAKNTVGIAQSQIALAAALVSGNVTVKTPARIEAQLRLRDEAKRPYERAGVPVSFKCKAQGSSSDPPQECDWPVCGCDAYADKVVAWFEEQGLVVDRHQDMIDKAALKAGDLG